MRIWDLKPNILCRQHLLAEHRELHGLWNILTQNKKGYSKHPETLRWIGKLPALAQRHWDLAGEMLERRYNHNSYLGFNLNKYTFDELRNNQFVNTIEEQKQILKNKKCKCEVNNI